MSWLVVRTKSQQEFRAEENLGNQGFQVYLPRFSYKNEKIKPLFPGYLFLAADNNLLFNTIRSTRGVLSLVRFGDQPAVASDELITTIQQNQDQFLRVSRFQPNDRVHIKAGPFVGLEAVYLCKVDEERSLILLTLLNRYNRITLEEKHLQLA